MKNKEIVNELKLLKGRVTELEGNKEKEKPKFEIGKWYKEDGSNYLACAVDLECKNIFGYGFGCLDKSWERDLGRFGLKPLEATNEEVIARLIEYWEKDNKGYEEYRFENNTLQGANNFMFWTTILNDRGKWVHSNPKKRTLTIEEAEKEFNVKIKQ